MKMTISQQMLVAFSTFSSKRRILSRSVLIRESTISYIDFCVVQIGLNIANEIFPEAIDYFLGNAGGDELDSEDEDDEDDDDEEIDLEKPRSKKQKV